MAESAKAPATEVPLYLKEVRIQNYAPLRDAQVKFETGLNILIGPNGVGKTRFLDLTSQLTTAFGVSYTGEGCELVFGFDHDVTVFFRQPVFSDKITAGFISSAAIKREADPGLDVVVSYKGQEHKADSLELALWDAGLGFELLPETVLAKHGTPIRQAPLVDLPATIAVQTANGRMRLEPGMEWVGYAARPRLANAIFSFIGSSFIWNHLQERRTKIAAPLNGEAVRREAHRIMTAFLDYINPYIAQYTPVAQMRLSNTYQVYDDLSQQEVLVKGLVLEYLVGESWLPFSALSDGTQRIVYLVTQLVMPVAYLNREQPFPAAFTLTSARASSG